MESLDFVGPCEVSRTLFSFGDRAHRRGAQALHPGVLRGLAGADGEPKATGEVADGQQDDEHLPERDGPYLGINKY